MRLSRATGYALHALAFLGRQANTASVSTKVIAGAIGIPDVFLLKSLKPLVARQLLSSITGPRGGYRLNRPAADISLLEVMEALEGPVRGESAYRSPQANSNVNQLLDRLTEEAARQQRDLFASYTVADLAGDGKGAAARGGAAGRSQRRGG